MLNKNCGNKKKITWNLKKRMFFDYSAWMTLLFVFLIFGFFISLQLLFCVLIFKKNCFLSWIKIGNFCIKNVFSGEKREKKKYLNVKHMKKWTKKKIENIDVGDTENHSSIFFMKSISRKIFSWEWISISMLARLSTEASLKIFFGGFQVSSSKEIPLK